MKTDDQKDYDEKDKDQDLDQTILADDPPIIVGGGGSTLIWINKDFPVTFVADPASLPHNPPKHPGNYYVLKVDVDIKNVDADDGAMAGGSHVGHSGMDPKKHRTTFE